MQAAPPRPETARDQDRGSRRQPGSGSQEPCDALNRPRRDSGAVAIGPSQIQRTVSSNASTRGADGAVPGCAHCQGTRAGDGPCSAGPRVTEVSRLPLTPASSRTGQPAAGGRTEHTWSPRTCRRGREQQGCGPHLPRTRTPTLAQAIRQGRVGTTHLTAALRFASTARSIRTATPRSARSARSARPSRAKPPPLREVRAHTAPAAQSARGYGLPGRPSRRPRRTRRLDRGGVGRAGRRAG